MDAPNPKIAEFEQLLWRMRDGAIDDDGLARIETLVTGDAEVRRFYIRYNTLCGGLRWLNAGEAGQRLVSPPAVENAPPMPFPSLSTTHYPLPTTPFVGSWAFSYMVSAVILGVAILGFWAYKITHHQHIAEAPSQSAPSRDRPEMVFVGRITGMVDVKWSDDPRYLPPPGFAHVPLGRKYILDAGLMEITYDSGAKVILEGPCTYEVESTGGGYLALGKLTAKVETRGEGRGARGEDVSHYPLSTTHYPLFSVRTPTAVVTDLGTEFGVEVDENGDVATHVLEGRVEFKVLGNGQCENQTIRISVGESVLLAKGEDGQAATVSLGKADAAAFPIRPGQLAEYVQEQREVPFRRWQAYSQKLRLDPSLVAYYTFETRGREATNAGAILPNVALTGEALDGRIDGPRWAEGRFRGKYALRFTGPNWRDRVELPEPEQFNFTGAFTVAVWFQIERFTTSYQALITKGAKTWRVQRFPGLDSLGFPTNSADGTRQEIRGASGVADRQWHLIAAVWSPADGKANKRLYLDGRLDAEGQSPLPLNHNNDPVWLGNIDSFPERAWDGLIDEVAIFSRALSGKEIEEMFAAGMPPESDESQEKNPSRLPKKEANR